MQFSISPSSRAPIYRQLATQIRAAVARGRLAPGAKLPSVRELSRDLVVNPNTVARAYRELERDGVLHSRQGMGVFIARPSNQLTKTARKRRFHEQLDSLLTEAVYLGFTRDEVMRLVKERIGRYQWAEREE